MSQLKIKDGNNWIDIPASGVGVPSGGTQGQFLVKSSSVDYATEWQTPQKVFTKLWTNPNGYSSNFSAQTIPLDLSGYDAVAIFVAKFTYNGDPDTTSSTQFFMQFCKVGYRMLLFSYENRRFAIVKSTGIQFETGYLGSNANDGCCIPLEVYGIKF